MKLYGTRVSDHHSHLLPPPPLRDSHIKHTRHAQRPARPLTLIPLQPGIHRILEFTDDRDGPFRAGEVGFFGSVDDLQSGGEDEIWG